MRVVKSGFITFVFLFIFAYFLYHTIYGNRGVVAKYRIEEKITNSALELEKIRAERLEIEHQVKLLRPDSLDKDMLEEQARKVLGVAKNDEEVIVMESAKEK